MEIGHRVAAEVTHLVRKPWLRRLTIWSGSAVALFAIAGFLIAPPIARHELERVLADKLQRKVSIERVRINPFAASAAIYQFAVKERDGSTTALAFDELYVNLAYSSLVRRALLVESLHLVRPYFHIVRNENKTYNFRDLIEAAATGPNQQSAAAASPLPRFSLFNIEVSDGRIDFDDRPEKAQHAITELRIGVPFISSNPGQVDIRVQPELRAKINGAPFALTGETKPFKDTHETTLRIDLHDLQIAQYIEYSPVPLHLRAPSGRLNAKLVV